MAGLCSERHSISRCTVYLVTASDPAAVVVAAEVADSSLITGVAVVENASKSTV